MRVVAIIVALAFAGLAACAAGHPSSSGSAEPDQTAQCRAKCEGIPWSGCDVEKCGSDCATFAECAESCVSSRTADVQGFLGCTNDVCGCAGDFAGASSHPPPSPSPVAAPSKDGLECMACQGCQNDPLPDGGTGCPPACLDLHC
jgi:hypothetical protein